VLVEIDGDESFFGEVYVKKQINHQGIRNVMLTAFDNSRFLVEQQIDGVLFNGYLPDQLRDITTLFATDITTVISPLARVQLLDHQGVYDISNIAINDTARIGKGGVSATDNQAAMMFTARSQLITKLRVAIEDGEDYKLVGGPFFFTDNPEPFVSNVQFSIQSVSAEGEAITPSGVSLTRKSGFTADIDFETRRKEGWSNHSIAFHTTGAFVAAGSGVDGFDWLISGGPSAGSSGVHIAIVDPTPQIGDERSNQMARIVYDGTNTITMRTEFITQPAEWASCMVRPNQTLARMHIDIFIGDGGSPKLAGRVIFSEGALNKIQVKDDSGTVDTGLTYVAGRIYSIHFKFDSIKRKFLVFIGNEQIGAPQFWIGGDTQFDYIDKDNFTSPGLIQSLAISAGVADDGSTPIGNAGDFDIGWTVVSKVGSTGTNVRVGGVNDLTKYMFRWVELDLSTDPIPVIPGTKYALRVSALQDQITPTLGSVRLFVGVIGSNSIPVGGAGGEAGTADVTFAVTSNGGSSWIDITSGHLAMQVIYSDSFAEQVEGTDFVVNYDGQEVIWQNAVIPTEQSRQVTDPISTIPNALISEYQNPSSGGIIKSTGVMTVASLVDELVSFVDGIAAVIVDQNGDGSNDLGTGTGFDAIQYDLLITYQMTIAEAIRILADEFDAIVYLKRISGQNFLVFEGLKNIVSVSATNPDVDNHEYLFSSIENPFDDALRLKDHTVTRRETDVYTTFIIKGKKAENVVFYKNQALITTLQREITRKPDIFPKETNNDNLWKFGELLNKLYGNDLIEGFMDIAGYYPLFGGRLDINGIFRLIEPNMESGSDTTGTNNVFKIVSLVYNGWTNQTRITLTNRLVNRDELEDQIDEQRRILNGIDPHDPKDDIVASETDEVNTISLPIALPVRMGLFKGAVEMDDARYIRLDTLHRIITDQVDIYHTFHAHFPAAVGIVDKFTEPITIIKIFDDNDIQLGSITLPRPFFKWSQVSMTFIFWIRETP